MEIMQEARAAFKAKVIGGIDTGFKWVQDGDRFTSIA
jgi:hypothetical protein